jgi:hypothetical protein
MRMHASTHARTHKRAHANAHLNSTGQGTRGGSRGRDGGIGGTLKHGEAVRHRDVCTALLVDVHGDAKDVHRCERKIKRSPCVCRPAGRSRALASAFGVVLGCTSTNGKRAGACVPACGPYSNALTAGRNRRSLRGRAGLYNPGGTRGLGSPSYLPEHTATDGEHHVTFSFFLTSQSPPRTSG